MNNLGNDAQWDRKEIQFLKNYTFVDSIENPPKVQEITKKTSNLKMITTLEPMTSHCGGTMKLCFWGNDKGMVGWAFCEIFVAWALNQ